METTDEYIQPHRPCSEEAVKLSVMDQLMPRRHMSYVMCFKQSPGTSTTSTIEHLKEGLAMALTEMPQFASELRKSSKSSKNELEIVLGPNSGVLFRTSTQILNYEELTKALVEGPQVREEELSIPADQLHVVNGGIPAFFVQATVVNGGVLLATSIHHVLGDAKASEIFFEAWAKHTAQRSHGRPCAIELVDEDTQARWRLSYGPKDCKMDSFLELLGPKSDLANAKSADHIVKSTWSITSSAIQELKNDVSAAAGTSVSSSDLMCALIARHVYKARLEYENQQSWPANVILYVTSDMRSRLEPPLSKKYIGNASVAVPIAVELQTLVSGSAEDALIAVAAIIKTNIDKFDTAALRSRLGFYQNQPFYGSVIPHYQYYPGPNMLVTDSSSMGFYSLDWGVHLHKMDNFRTIGQTHAVGSCTLNPKRANETIELQVRHDLRIVDAMKADKGFSQYFKLEGCY